ncbi:hypothetical protein BABINDRAFT_167976 [Babjeviella inositovora NRRL Y-12698]|uniref:Uncharacterized protein n=1 Tax=Babjeviella inositovora NRRL Y-12698 TaxID=984486 RepID=A0A1E3QM68_9ASCO|nr:uncharacterized protein BABINDRAFT_167976 [Babjeviella inositovora NRRL Y-12698]ODQ78793.1 hypothetical protein BABINDRAFT_167976 [Babjeviella inositovora NRRL Y-12698]
MLQSPDFLTNLLDFPLEITERVFSFLPPAKLRVFCGAPPFRTLALNALYAYIEIGDPNGPKVRDEEEHDLRYTFMDVPLFEKFVRNPEFTHVTIRRVALYSIAEVVNMLLKEGVLERVSRISNIHVLCGFAPPGIEDRLRTAAVYRLENITEATVHVTCSLDLETPVQIFSNLIFLRMVWHDDSTWDHTKPIPLPETLQTLMLQYPAVPVTVYRNLPSSLKSVYLEGVDNISISDFNSIEFSPSLTDLTIANTPGWEDLRGITLPPRLEALRLVELGIESFSGISLPATLKSLTLEANLFLAEFDVSLPANLVDLAIITSHLASLEKVQFPETLRNLELLRNRIRLLGFLSNLPDGLDELFMEMNDLGGEDDDLSLIRLPSQLRTLDLEGNDLFTNHRLCDLALPPSLRNLHLRQTGLLSLADVTFPPALSILDLLGNPLSTINNITFPDTLEDLLMEELKLTLVTAKLPDSLLFIDFRGMPLKTLADFRIPQSCREIFLGAGPLGSFSFLNWDDASLKLTRLYVEECDIASPLDIGRLPPGIKTLCIEKNRLVTLQGLELPPHLVELRVSDNYITSLNGLVFPDSVKYLELRLNRITSVESVRLPESLTRLSLAGNRLTNIDGMVLPPRLEYFGVNENSITEILHLELPESLLTLQLQGQKEGLTNILGIKKLPAGLKRMDISSNLLTSFNYAIPKGMKVLYIHDNPGLRHDAWRLAKDHPNLRLFRHHSGEEEALQANVGSSDEWEEWDEDASEGGSESGGSDEEMVDAMPEEGFSDAVSYGDTDDNSDPYGEYSDTASEFDEF